MTSEEMELRITRLEKLCEVQAGLIKNLSAALESLEDEADSNRADMKRHFGNLHTWIEAIPPRNEWGMTEFQARELHKLIGIALGQDPTPFPKWAVQEWNRAKESMPDPQINKPVYERDDE